MRLTEQERQIADALAQTMARNVDANEVGKVLAFWRRWRSPEKVFVLLERLPRSGTVRSGRTRGYYEAIRRAFSEHRKDIRPEVFGTVLGWSFRLMRYYQLEAEHRGNTPRRRQT